MTRSKRSLMHSEALKTQAGRHEEFETPSWAVLLAAVLAMALNGSLAHPGVTAGIHYPTVRVAGPSAESMVLR